MEGPVVEIVVGTPTKLGSSSINPKGQKTWFFPRALICHECSFFRTAFENLSKSDPENKLSLADDEPGTFQLFVQWLYYKEVTVQNETQPATVHPCVKGWIFGDKLGLIDFRDCCMKVVYQVFTPTSCHGQIVGSGLDQYLIDPATIKYTLTRTMVGSHLYRYFFDALVKWWSKPWQLIIYNGENMKEQWDEVWDAFPKLRNGAKIIKFEPVSASGSLCSFSSDSPHSDTD